MNNSALPINPQGPQLATAEIAARLDCILALLMSVVAAHFRILGPLTLPLWTRISRTRQVFARLLALLAAGSTPRRPGSRTWRRPPDAAPAPPIGAGPVPRLSRRFAWIVARIGYRAAGQAGQLDYLLQQPGVAAILAASPGTARALRPLCRILGITLPPALCLPPRPPRPKPRPAMRHSPPPPPLGAPPLGAPPLGAPPPGTPDRPLPSYIRAAVRAWKRGPQKFA